MARVLVAALVMIAVAVPDPGIAARAGSGGGGFMTRPLVPGSGLLPLAGVQRRALPPAQRAVELAESVPVATRLGNRDLRSTHTVWIEMIRGARLTLDLEHFYLSTWPGEAMDAVVREMTAAGRRGVRVRLLLDARMFTTYPQPAESLATRSGIEVRTVDYRALAGGVQHAKFLVVDGRRVFVGSQNFDWRALSHIHELGVRVDDARVALEFVGAFERDWSSGRAPRASADSLRRAADPGDARKAAPWRPVPVVQAAGDTVWTVSSFSPRAMLSDSTVWDRDAIVRLIDGARSEVVVQLLSYGLGRKGRRDDTLDRALRGAAARGVRVRLIVSDWQADSERIADVQDLVTAGVDVRMSRVEEWSRAYIPFARVEHCKFMVADTAWTWVGTANWEPGYFTGSRNAAVSLGNRRLALDARRTFETSWTAPGATPIVPGRRYEPRIHREEPPPGVRVHGR